MSYRTLTQSSVLLLLIVGMLYYCFGLYSPSLVDRIPLARTHQGNWSDLYPRWFGTRALLINKRNPYSEQVTEDIQRGFYGRTLDPGNPVDPKDREEFAYPAYIVFLLAPTVWMNFREVQIGFIVAMIAGTGLAVSLWIRALGLQFSTKAVWFATALVLSSYHFLFALKLEQLTLLVQILVALSVAAIADRRYVLGGILLACSSIKPQLIFLLAFWLCLWSSGKWAQRKTLLLSYMFAMIFLVLGADFLLPHWVHYWLVGTLQYRSYVSPSLLAVVFGPRAVWLEVLLLGAFAVFCWMKRGIEFRTDEFGYILAAATVASLLVVPNGVAQYNSVMLLPVVLLLASWYLRGGRGLTQVLFLWLAGEWGIAAAVALHAVATGDHKAGLEIPQKLVTFFPLVAGLALAVRPHRHAHSQGERLSPAFGPDPSFTAT